MIYLNKNINTSKMNCKTIFDTSIMKPLMKYMYYNVALHLSDDLKLIVNNTNHSTLH